MRKKAIRGRTTHSIVVLVERLGGDRFGFGRLDSYREVVKAQKGMLMIADPVN